VALSGSPGSPAQVLHDNGWKAYRLSLVADADSVTVSGFDFDTQLYGGTIQVNWGITGVFAQEWGVIKGVPTPTPNGNVPLTSSTDSSDSFFFNMPSGEGSKVRPFIEDSNLESPGIGEAVEGNPPYDHNPLPDTSSLDYGVGTYLHVAGTIFHDYQQVTQ